MGAGDRDLAILDCVISRARHWPQRNHVLRVATSRDGSAAPTGSLVAMLNAYWEALTFELPPAPAESQQRWRRCMDTALASPDDFQFWDKVPVMEQASYVVQPRSMVFLIMALQTAAECVSQAK